MSSSGRPVPAGSAPLLNVRNVSSDTTAAAGDILYVDTTNGPVAIALPDTPGALAQVLVKKINDDSGVHAVTVTAHGSGLIDRASNLVMSAFNESATFQNIAADTWKVIGEVRPSAAQSGSPTLKTALGNSGSAFTIATAGATDVWQPGVVLNAATVTATLSGLGATAQRVKIIGKQDATGGRVLRVDDGSGAQTVGIAITANADFEVAADWDGTKLTVYNAGGSGAAGAQGPTGATGPTGPTGATGNPGADETVNNVAASSTAQTIPAPSAASVSRIVLTANCTLTFPTAAAGRAFTVVLVQDATGSRTVTWPTVSWPAGSTPTLTTTASKRDVFTFLCADGTNWLGFVAGQNI